VPRVRRADLRHLHDTSKIAVVNYYRCETCGHIWTVHKGGPVPRDARHAVAE